MNDNKQTYISHVHLKGYKSIRDMEIDLKPGLNIIIGPNGSGKTNFLELLRQVFHKDIKLKDINAELTFVESNVVQRIVYFTQLIDYRSFKNILETTIEIEDNKKISKENFASLSHGQVNLNTTNDNSLIVQVFFLVPKMKLIKFGIDRNFEEILEEEISFEYFSETVSKKSNKQEISNSNHILFKTLASIDFEKEGLNDKQFLEKLTNQITIDSKLVENLQHYSPIENIAFEKDRIKIIDSRQDDFFEIQNLQFTFLVGKKWLYWNQLSDGTKRIFYIIFNVLYSEEVVIAIEEPELGIHPNQLHLLMDFLKEQSQEKQIIITTHSPEVLNILDKEELDRIIITRYDNEKGTQMHRLSPHQIKKGQMYMDEVGYLSNYWVHSNLEEYEESNAR